MSLDAVALDTETTGLDARTARLIEIAVVPIQNLKVAFEGALQQIVDPLCPIPEASSLIHGLTERDLRGAPEFRHVVSALEKHISGAVIIGHNVGYDLAIIDREYARAGLNWTLPRFLDIRALARLAAPHLASYELGALCNWLEVEISRRHRALPDALAAGEAFIKLVPQLRACGIRTLAEAETAARDLPGEERLYQVGGWISPAQALTAQTAPAIAAVDSYPYRHRVRDLVHSKPTYIECSTSVAEAAVMAGNGTSGGIVLYRAPDGSTGFLSAAHLLEMMVAASSGSSTLRDALFRPLPMVGEDDFLYRALGRMSRLDTPHIGVVDRSGTIVGTLSAEDLIRHRATSALVLGDEVEAAQTVPDLGRAWAKLPRVVYATLQEGVQAPEIAAIISAEIRNLTARAAKLAEQQMTALGKGGPPCRYAVLVLGSAGRGESLLNADQDNAIVFEKGGPGGPEDTWFAAAGAHIADTLHAVGVPYCSGGVMAKNPGCRHSLEVWKTVVAGWIEQAGPTQVLAADIFFDAVPVHGDLMLGNDLLSYAVARAEKSTAFTTALASFNKNWQPPITLLGRLARDRDDRTDMKRLGLLPLVTTTRALALRYGIRPTSTIARLMELKVRSLVSPDVVDQACSAYSVISRAILCQQVSDGRDGIALSARVNVAKLRLDERQSVLSALRAISGLIGVSLAQ